MDLIVPASQFVILLVGISGSGKSTLGAELARGRADLEVVSYDAHQHRLDGTDPAQNGRVPVVPSGP